MAGEPLLRCAEMCWSSACALCHVPHGMAADIFSASALLSAAATPAARCVVLLILPPLSMSRCHVPAHVCCRHVCRLLLPPQPKELEAVIHPLLQTSTAGDTLKHTDAAS